MKPQRSTRITNKLLCILCLFVASQSNVHAQTPKKDPAEALRQLLNLPEPRPPSTDERAGPEYPATFFDKNNPPPDDAPIADLITYWSRWVRRPDLGISDTVRQRLFEFCLDDPKYFVHFVSLVPQTKAAATKIKEVYDKAELRDIERGYVEPADELTPIAFVPQNKVLLRRARNQYMSRKEGVGPDRPEHYLLDPTTGDVRVVTGEFSPLYEKGNRFLEPTDQPNEFWAAIPDENKKQTQVGRYNVKDFTFKSLLTVPHISFKSLSMWVDERQKNLYVVYEGQLLRLPMP